ncbi:MAG TPA: FimV/HubP family polar landmark protein, partial [Paraburkholderia sp.]|nr:FimV/HubP family polar landmark protein [Paraburkholderia sp.]
AGVPVAEGSLAQDAAAASARAAEPEDGVSTREQIPVREASDASDEAAAYGVALSAAGREGAAREVAEREAAAREVAERVAAEREAEIRAAAAREAAQREAAAGEAAKRLAAEHAATEHTVGESTAAQQAAAERAEAERVAADQAAQERAAGGEQAAAREQAAAGQQAAAKEQAAEEHEASTDESHTAFPTQEPNASPPVWPESHAAPAPLEPAQPRADIEPAAQSGSTSEPLPSAHHENLDGAATAASLAAAAELGAEALPLTSLEPVSETFQQEAPPHRLQWDDEPASSAPAAPLAESANESQTRFDTPAPVIDFTPHEAAPRTTSPFDQPSIDTSAHPAPDTSVPAVPAVQQHTAHVDPAYKPSHQPQPQAQQQSHQQAETATPDGAPTLEPAPVEQTQPARSIPSEFPRDAVDAFSSLNMPLPPRVESTDAAESAPESLSTQPVASPEATAQQAVAPHDPDDTPHVSDEFSAGTAGHAAVAGLGAVGFGALKLDFDLELPPSPAQPLPAFTRADLSRIARNKLDLAAEYIDLGDLSGARLLINEVIEANDPATRTEARALLSTLAPLS